MIFHKTSGFLLFRVATAHRNYIEKRLSDVGLHSGQVFVLFELWNRDGRRQVDLASELGIAAPTVNKTITGMVETGLVTRDKYEGDARSTRIYLTEEGQKLRIAVEELWLEVEQDLLSQLTETERLILTDILIKLRHFYFGTEPE